jgi:serine phosphatase RsbU (regulator of sigma subunit)
VPLGTLWFFCKRERLFTDEQTNVAEVIAGKIASDLDRAVLIERQTSQKDLQTQVVAARRVQEHQLPVAPPPLAGWNIGGWAEQAGSLGGAFYDWRMIDESSLLVMLGDSCEDGIESALASSALRAALRIDDDETFDIERLTSRANRILWENSSGAWWAGLWLGQIQLDDGRCDFSAFGRPSGLLLRSTPTRRASEGATGWASLVKPTEPVGLEPVIKPAKKQLILSPGESLIVCNRGVLEACNEKGRPLGETAIARSLLKNLNAPPERMIEIVRDLLQSQGGGTRHDRSILVVKRLPI